ncbi:o-succinylbenzoate--CoA ligase [Bacillus songklensis]|uniref:2-succinylbenzoate--CoA ligase n=1 Tax=Bacillus songklensis TaxID=1069116 RepID=A0ABV8B342_9BACI
MTYQTIPNWLMKRADLTPDRIAISAPSGVLTFRQLHEQALGLAEKCVSLGIRKSDMTAILASNSLEMVIFIHAMKYIGAKTLLLNTRLTSHEMRFQLEDAGVKTLLVNEDFLHTAKEAQVYLDIKIHTFKEVMQTSKQTFDWIKEFQLDNIDTIMYTSGTTGNPKGVMQTYGNHWWSAVGSALNLGLQDKDAWLCTVPLFHISGLSILMRGIIYGMKVVLHEKFDPSLANRAIKEEGITIASVVTAMLSRMLDDLGDEAYPSHFRCMLLGGGPAPLPVLERCSDLNIPVYQTYGMTETASQIVTLPPEYSLTKLGSAGKPLFPCEVQIQTRQGEKAEAKQPGEIVVKGPNVTEGYLNRPEATNEALQNGWFHTGDIGYLDEEGFLYVLDRRSDLIISGGENVYPAEIESVLLSHPLIIDAGVTGMEDEKWGQIPCAFLVKQKGAFLTEEEVKHYCLERLAKYKVPHHIYFVDGLPRNASNKLVRRQLPLLLEKYVGKQDEH